MTFRKYCLQFFVLAFLVFSLIPTTLAQHPVPRKGDCAVDWYKSGDYCKPYTGTKEQIVPITGDKCPIGYFKSRGYCKPYSNNEQETIPSEDKCPVGYLKSGDYCKKHG